MTTANLVHALFETVKRGYTAKRKPAIYGYSSFDIEFALNGIEVARDLFLSAVKGYLESTDEVAGMVDFDGFANRVHDLMADELRGPLMKRLEEMRGER